MTDKPGDYEVGYGKPPKSTRFKKGKSGNPRGRPKNSKKNENLDFWATFLAESNKTIGISQDGEKVFLKLKDALIRKMYSEALKGNMTAAKTLMQFLERASPVEQSIKRPMMVIKPSTGPIEPMPPIYTESDD